MSPDIVQDKGSLKPMQWRTTNRTVALAFVVSMSAAAAGQQRVPRPEPNTDIAAQWWPEMENVWTPVGWKNHPIRANVLYNGMVVVEPRHPPYKGRGVLIEFIPSRDGRIPRPNASWYRLADKYGPVGNQGWNDCAAPVLWTRWHRDEIVWRMEAFGHAAGGRDVGFPPEPLYLWIRLAVEAVEKTPASGRCYWLIKINKPYLHRTMHRRDNLSVSPKLDPTYPRDLRLTGNGRGSGENRWRLVEGDGTVRLGIVGAAECDVSLIDQRPSAKNVWLRIEIPARPQSHVDLLLPALPDNRTAFNAEFALGRDRALNQAERYWKQVPPTAAMVDTPEPSINNAIRRNLQFVELLAMRLPKSGRYCQLSGSWHYEKLWPTPTCMTHSMILDALGYHSVAARYLEVFRENQGERMPPGKSWRQPPPGYFSAPRSMASIDWLSDHGAILFAVCNHALVTGDEEFIERWQEPIVKACEFIRDSIAMTEHGGVEGVLPPAVATDLRDQVQAVWSDGWNYKGLTAAVRLLRRCGHPRAAEFAEVARAYKAAFVTAFRKAAGRTEQWTDKAGTKHHYVPMFLSGEARKLGRRKVPYYEHPFYLDTGPLFLVYAGLMDAADPLMRQALRYFRAGPHQFDISGDFDVPPVLHHGISSCEPCYSWNVFHSHQLGDRYRFLEGMYSLFAGGLSRQTYISSETRGGISGTVFTAPLAIWLMRLAVIDDQIKPGELHLLRLVPRAWLRSGRQSRFERMPTQFGPISLRFLLTDDARTLKVSFSHRFRHAPRRVVLHVPPIETLREVIANRARYPARAGCPLPIQEDR